MIKKPPKTLIPATEINATVPLGEYKQRGHTPLSYGLVSIEVKRKANGNER